MKLLTHLLIAFLVCSQLPSMNWAVIIIYSVLADIDTPASFIGRRLPALSWPAKLLLGHRGFFHSALAGFLVSIPLVPLGAFMAGLVGYAVHLFTDALTPQGIMLFFPLSSKKLKGPIKTGGLSEFCLQLVLIIVLLHWTLDMLG